MIGSFGNVADRVDEHERARPAVGFVVTTNPAFLVVPARECSEALRYLGVVVGWFFRRHCFLRSAWFDRSENAGEQEQVAKAWRSGVRVGRHVSTALAVECGRPTLTPLRLTPPYITTPPPTSIVWPVTNEA